MKKQSYFLTFAFAAFVSMLSFTSCSEPPTEVDESGYLGTYHGRHFLADSNFIRGILGDPTATMIYADTLVITNGTSTTDGIIVAKSSLLGGNSIEIEVATGKITPVNLGNISILGTVLKSTKLQTGSTGTWNTDKTVVNTHLLAYATYDFDGTDIPLGPLTINGVFNKQ